MQINFEVIKRYFSEGDVIASGGGRRFFRITEILDDRIRIQPTVSQTASRLGYDKLSVVIANFKAINPNKIEITVGEVLKANGLKDTQNESYLYGMAREILLRKNQISALHLQNEFDRELEKARMASPSERKEDTKKYPKKPKQISVSATQYQRNPYVVIEVLERADGICEGCKSPAPFTRAKDNTPYLEVHHIDQLANGGEDTVKNAQALCPNCHREKHCGIIA